MQQELYIYPLEKSEKIKEGDFWKWSFIDAATSWK